MGMFYSITLSLLINFLKIALHPNAYISLSVIFEPFQDPSNVLKISIHTMVDWLWNVRFWIISRIGNKTLLIAYLIVILNFLNYDISIKILLLVIELNGLCYRGNS